MKNLIMKMTCISLGLASMCMAQNIVITQNPDCATDSASAVACGAEGTTAENWYARNILIDQDVTIDSITWGAGAVNSTSATIYFSVASGPGNPDGVTLTPVGQATAAIDAGPFYDTPVDTPFEVSAGSYLVVEIQFPDSGDEAGIWPASTTTATETTYIKAADCGLEYTDVADIGFPTSQIIMCLNATLGDFDPCTVPLPALCPADLDGDGQVAVPDILIVIGNWGDVGDGTYRPEGDCAPLPNGNCATDVADVLAVVASWGADCNVYGACCLSDGTCNEGSTADDCALAGGTYFGDNSSCADGDCSVLACCLADMSCVEVTADSCAGLGGMGHAGDDCTSWDCSVALPGDECADAIAVYDGPNTFDTSTMTAGGSTPDDAMCTGTYLNWGGEDGWYSYVATGGSTHFTTCDAGSYDTSMVLYEGSCENQVACNGDSVANDGAGCQTYYSDFTYECVAGTTYYVRIGAYNSGSGPGTLTIEVAGPPVPGACCMPNNQCLDNLDSDSCDAFGGVFAGEDTTCADDPSPCVLPMGACCAVDNTCSETDATTCGLAGGLYRGDLTSCADIDCAASGLGDECIDATVATLGANWFNTTAMTASQPQPDDTMCSGQGLDWTDSPDGWMSFVAGSDAPHTFTTCDLGSVMDTSIVLYEGDCNTQVACNGDMGDVNGGGLCQDWYSQIDWDCTSGTTYYIRIGGWQAETGIGTLHISAADTTVTAACCDWGTCLGDLTLSDCDVAGGYWNEGESCGTYACPQPACPGAQVSQNVHGVDDGWSAGTSTDDPSGAVNYERAESVNLASMSDMSVWGLQLFYDGAAWGACTADYGFNVRAYDDAGGMPGALSYEALDVTAVKTATGDLYAGAYEGYRYDMDFAASNVGWIGVQSASDGLNCWFLWMSSGGFGDDSSALSVDGGAWDMSYAFDLAICVN